MMLLSYAQIFSHVHSVAKILGMWPFKRVKGRLHFSKVRLVQSFICCTISLVLTIQFFLHFSSDLMEEFGRARIIQFLIVLRSASNVSVMILLIVYNFLFSEKTSSAIVRLQEADQAMIALGQKDALVRSNWKNRRAGHFMLGINLASNLASGILKTMTKCDNQIIYFFVVTYPRIIVSNFNTYYFLLTRMLEDRFRMINLMVVERLKESTKLQKYPVDSDFSKKITDFIWWHKNLVDVVRSVNEIYNLNLLFCITTDFVLLVGDLYITMYALFFDLLQKHYMTILSVCMNCFFYVIELFYFSKRSSDVCNEANRTHTLVSGIHIDVDKEEERDTVIVSILKLLQNKLEITAFRLFTVDNTLLFSICGAASSYLFIMLQLDLGKNRNSANASTNASII